MRKVIRVIITMAIFTSLITGCGSEESNSCEDDKKNEKWGDIATSVSCSPEERGEAYLALGGFDYFKFIGNNDQNLNTVLNLNAGNWRTKLGYYQKAADVVKNTYKTGSDSEKSIFLLASFLTLYTYLTGNLDNGEGGAIAFDGKFEGSEVSGFTGTRVSGDSGGDDGTILDPTGDYQIVVNRQYYLASTGNGSFYFDSDADGIKDSMSPITDAGLLAAFGVKSNWSALNQISYLNKLSDPFSATGGTQKAIEIARFSENLVVYMGNIREAMLSLGVDNSADYISQITSFQQKIDNGGGCQTFKNNPNTFLVELFTRRTQRERINGAGDYSKKNVFTASELIKGGEDASFDSPPGVSVDLGVKLLFRNKTGGYDPYWSDATDDVRTAMENIALFNPENVAANDNKIAFSELICASELLSADK